MDRDKNQIASTTVDGEAVVAVFREDSFTNARSQKLYCVEYLPTTGPVKAAIIFNHGIMEHTARYADSKSYSKSRHGCTIQYTCLNTTMIMQASFKWLHVAMPFTATITTVMESPSLQLKSSAAFSRSFSTW